MKKTKPKSPCVQTLTARETVKYIAVHQLRWRELVLTRDFELRRQELLTSRQWESYLITFDGHTRLAAFLNVCEEMSDKEYWKCLEITWSNIEVSAPNLKTWLRLFESPRGERQKLMTASERRTLQRLPETLFIFRGYAKGINITGMSWTLSENIALRFAKYAISGRRRLLCGHSGKEGMVVMGAASKRDVLAYFNGRKEQEIVIRPDKVILPNHGTIRWVNRTSDNEV